MRIVPVLLSACLIVPLAAADTGRIAPWSENPRYWMMDGEPVLLLGSSSEDNLFQLPEDTLRAELDALRDAGGNYVRCTMSSRDEGNGWAFARADGRYDLARWNDAYWRRFERFLELTAERGIVVQIEVWATFDFYREPWKQNPFNPANNTAYTPDTSGLPTEVNSHPTRTENPFFWSVPAEHDNATVLPHQRAFVDKLLDHSLAFGHVLYCMDNETSVTPEWGAYWAGYIRDRARREGLEVHVTEMWDDHNLRGPQHRHTLDHPERYTFVDVSQNNHQRGQAHWDGARWALHYLRDNPRPANNVKIYGADGSPFGDTHDAVARFWRNVFVGMASARFHRPGAGIGASGLSYRHIRSARMLGEGIHLFNATPRDHLVDAPEGVQAYAVSDGAAWAVLFPAGGKASVEAGDGPWRVRWLDTAAAAWRDWQPAEMDGARIVLAGPAEGVWVALVRPAQD